MIDSSKYSRKPKISRAHDTLLNNIQTQHEAHINEIEKLVQGGIYLT